MDYKELLNIISRMINEHLNKGVGLNEFCRNCGLSAQVISKLRDNKASTPNPSTLIKIANGLKLPPTYFMDLLNYLNGQTKNDPRITHQIDTKIAKPSHNPKKDYEKHLVFKINDDELIQYVKSRFTDDHGRPKFVSINNNPEPFLVECFDESMIADGIKNTDFCLINPHEPVKDGDIVFVIHENDDPIIRKLKKSTNGVVLISSNSLFEPIFIENKNLSNWSFYKVVESRHKF